MELRHLRYFAALAEHLNFTRASGQVHVTQSTMSHQIKQLESELGCRLFERTRKRVALTYDGHTFLGSVTKALREIDDGIVQLKDASVEISGALSVGSIHTFNASLLPQCLSTFLARNPSVQARVEEGPASALEKRLVAGALDVVIAYPPRNAKALRYEPVLNEELVLAVPADHRLARRRKIRMVELHRQRLVLPPRDFATRQLLDGCFRSVGADPVVVAEFNTSAPMLDFVRRMKIASIVAEHAVGRTEGIKAVQIEDPTPVRTLSLLWRRNKPHSSVARAFADIVKRVAKAERQG